ncbi:MAG: glycosyltransferase family 2 protein [Caldilineales bacterium]|nr:glycosyltransferase family 2 protein [Caldilineales bacterium]
MTTLTVVIPAWNEEDGITDIMQRVLNMRPNLPAAGVAELELIVVDDGSTDSTADLVGACDGVRLVRHEQNGGYGAALKTGFANAQGELIGFLDADGTYPPEHFPALCRKLIETDADIVIGSRMSGAESEMPRVRWLGNKVFAGLVSLISAERITDSASGMRVFKKSILDRIYPLPDGLNLTPVMSTRALHEGLHMVETPIPYSERVGRSKLSVTRDGVRFAQSIVWTALSYNPARLLGMAGLAALGLAVLIALGVLYLRLQGVTSLDPLGAYLLFAGVVLAVSGLSLITLGVSFNYFVALFHGKPVQRGAFTKSIIKHHFDQYLGWIGLLTVGFAILLSLVSLSLGARGWPVDRLWFYYLISACLALVGVQLAVAYIQMQVLDALRTREALVVEDLQRNEQAGITDSRIATSTGRKPVVQ